MAAPSMPREGAHYKTIQVAGHPFTLRYGYYEERERELCPPVVIFPDLAQSPLHCSLGYPLVTQIQDPCAHYQPLHIPPEDWCGDCRHYYAEHPEIGICRCEMRRESK